MVQLTHPPTELGARSSATSPSLHETLPTQVAAESAVSWAAVFAGAAGAAALSMILLILGSGLGLSSVSPWENQGVSATTLGISTVVWLTLTQLLSSGMGGYLAGRLRTKWTNVRGDETYFRDTAHGFLSWAVASLATAALLTSVISSVLGTGAQAGASMASGALSMATTTAATAGAATAASPDSGPSTGGVANIGGYFVDSLFRRDPNAASPGTPNPNDAAGATAEVSRIFLNSVRTGALPPEDVRYVGQVVSQRTGLPAPEAERRVNETYARLQTTMRDTEQKAREAAETARKASSRGALWLFVSMLIGAFVASFAATLGGKQRDD
ncbi:MAG: hypothetical protein V4739_08820 [Pseudomonadota bacterium]